MFVNFNAETGAVTATLSGIAVEGPDWIEVAEQDLGELTDWKVIDGELTRYTIVAMREQAVRRINERISDIRRRYITEIPGQDGIYAAKEDEAADYVSGAEPADLHEYPFLAAEVGISAPDAYQLAQLWLNMGEQWRQVGAALEGLRTGTVAAAKMAEDAATIEAILTMFAAQIDAI